MADGYSSGGVRVVDGCDRRRFDGVGLLASGGPHKIPSRVVLRLKRSGRLAEVERVSDQSLLISCEACDRMVSREARTCPQCGHPIADKVQSEASTSERQQQPSRGDAADDGYAAYPWALGLGVASIFLGTTFGVIAWLTALLSLYALLIGPRSRKRWMAWVGLFLGIAYAISNAYAYGHLDAALESTTESADSVASADPDSATTSTSAGVEPAVFAAPSQSTQKVTLDGDYRSIDELIAAVEAAGYHCSDWNVDYSAGNVASERASCDTLGLAIFPTERDAMQAAVNLSELTIQHWGRPISVHRVGPTWAMNCSVYLQQCEALEAVGGELFVAQAP